MGLEGWRRVRLGEVMAPISRLRPVEPDRSYPLLGVRWYGNGCHLHDTIHGSKLKTSVLNAVETGDVTYNKMWVSKGAFAVVDEGHGGLFATSEYPTFQAVPEATFPPFLRSAFKDPNFISIARESCRGTTSRARLNPRDFLELSIALPPLGEQRKIAAILSSVDDAIGATQAVIDQLQVVKKAMMAELLTRGLPGRHTRFKQSEIGEVPEDWEVVPLDSVAMVIDPNPSHRYPPDIPVGVPLVSTANFDGLDSYDMSTAQHVSEDTFEEQNSRCDFSPEDVVFARKGRIGFARRYGLERKVFSHTIVIMKATARISPSFLLWLVRSSAFLGEIDRTMNTNSGVPTLGVKLIADTLVAIPDRSEQARIANVLETVAKRESDEVRVLEGAKDVKFALMSVLLTGEVRVTPDEAAA